jgi:hypothetical protein
MVNLFLEFKIALWTIIKYKKVTNIILKSKINIIDLNIKMEVIKEQEAL